MASNSIFSLEGRSLKLETAKDLEPHIAQLRDNPSVEEVRLGGNTYGVEACQALADLLRSKKKLQIANLADIFTSRLLSEIPKALSALLIALLTLPRLHTINLSDNAFGLNTINPLTEFLSKHAPLRHLYLNNNGMGPIAGAKLADAISDLYQVKQMARERDPEADIPQLETIICGRNRLENGSMPAWANLFSKHTSVRTVKMVQNGIRPDGIVDLLSKGLSHCRLLEVLDLQDNTFTLKGSRALSMTLPTWEQLIELGVGDCLLGARGMVLVMLGLQKNKNKQLETLRLQYNEFIIGTLKELNTAIREGALPSLRRVEVNGNKLDEESVELEKLRGSLAERRKQSREADREDAWGLDSLSDLEEEDDEDEENDATEQEGTDEDSDKDAKAERILEEAEEAENAPVAQEDDKNIDDLAAKLGKASI